MWEEYILNNFPTIALAIITAIYVFLTYKILKEQEKGRKEVFKPKISAKPHFITPIAMDVKIANIGKGSALNVNIVCETDPTSITTTWHTNFLEPEESQEISLKHVYLKDIYGNYNQILITAEYDDVYGAHFHERTAIDVKQLQNSLKHSIAYKEDFHDQMDDAIKKLDNIDKSIKRLDKISTSLKDLDDINKSIKRLNDIDKSLKKLDDIDKGIDQIEKTVRGLGPIFKKGNK